MKPSRAVAAAIGASLLALPATAGPGPVRLESAVYVERESAGHTRLLEPARRFAHGDRLVYVLRWSYAGSAGLARGFTLTNPLPHSVYYQGSADGREQVSVDGGKTWGRIGTLRVGTRLATPEDVTHVRWRVDPGLANASSGHIAYSAIVR